MEVGSTTMSVAVRVWEVGFAFAVACSLHGQRLVRSRGIPLILEGYLKRPPIRSVSDSLIISQYLARVEPANVPSYIHGYGPATRGW